LWYQFAFQTIRRRGPARTAYTSFLPTYRFGAELRARDAVRQFVRDDQRISENWQSILETGRKNNL
jgi:hypothetical protein